MIKGLLVVWLGFGNSQTLSITQFSSMPECQAASRVLSSYHRQFSGVVCLPYRVGG